MTPQFGPLLRELRTARGWSLRDLATRICFHRAYVGKIEQSEKFPDRRFAELADQALSSGRLLVDAWVEEAEARRDAEQTGRLLVASAAESLRLLSVESDVDVDALHAASDELAVAYLASPPAPMLQEAVALRARIVERLQRGSHPEASRRELLSILGHVQGILTYAALDLGDPDVALTHAQTGWMCAERAEDDELKVWTRGTQSLVLRFQKKFEPAQRALEDALAYDVAGTGRLRALSGIAQCRANLGDALGANEALDVARRERDTLRSTDTAPGLFEFSQAKQYYYAGSSLMWLPDPKDSRRAADDAGLAIEIWQGEPPQTRSLDDEALAHIYRATALMKLGLIGEAAEAVAPILDLPPERQISWIHRRLGDFATQLDTRYPKSSEANELVDKIQAITG